MTSIGSNNAVDALVTEESSPSGKAETHDDDDMNDNDSDEEESEGDGDDEEEEEDGDDGEDQNEEKTPQKRSTSKKSAASKKSSTPKSTGSKNPKTPSSSKSKSSNANKSPSSSIPYSQLVQDAILAMKDRTGSSQVAIQKWILNNHPEIDPQKVKQRLLITLKNGIKTERLIKVKASYKINQAFLKKQKKKAVIKKKASAKAAAEKKKKRPLTKAELAALKEKERREKAEKERQDRIRKRKFPMDDLKLIEEDKELKVVVKKPPRPSLELAMPHFPSTCKSDTTGSGLLDDVFHIYHFFRGDLGWGRLPKQKAVVAPFTLDQWMQCVEHVLKGWAKKARMLPPLMSHLFVVALQQLVPDKLQVALTPASWGEVLVLYMDAMERYYTTEASEEANVIPSLGIDTEYLFYVNDESKEVSKLDAPNPVSSYLYGVLGKAHSKLVNQDPWTLSAEELLSLLKALVDDVLAVSEDCAEDLDVRIDETYELLKVKRSADANYRKLQSARNKEIAEEKKDRKTNGEEELATRSNVKMAKISEAKMEKARLEQERATHAYEKASRGKCIRTEPVGLDRNFNEAYHSWNDPERVFILQRGKLIPSELPFEIPDEKLYRTTWHSIDKKSTLDKFMDSLDTRGRREHDLYEALQPVRRMVYDDVKEMNEKKARLKEKNNLKSKLEYAQLKLETGRKSGRLAAQSEQELIDLQDEIEKLEKSILNGDTVKEYDFQSETGLDMLRAFDEAEESSQRKRASRRETQKRKEEEEEASVPKMPCSVLWPSGITDGTGIVGMMVNQLLELEERMENLANWETGDRKTWIASLEKAIVSWNESTLPHLLPESNSESAVSSADNTSTSQILSMIKQPLLELENRLFEASGLAMAAKDEDEADENMSTSPEDEEEQIKNAWKKTIARLKRLPAKASVKIKTAVIDAIAAARKAHNMEIVAQLRNALVDYHPEAAGSCKTAALEVLAAHGDYEDDDEDDEDEDEDEIPLDADRDVDTKAEPGVSSVLCAEAVILNSSLEGQEDAGRNDWIFAVKKTRTISKMAALISSFSYKASAKLEKIESEQAALKDALDALNKTNSLRTKKSPQEIRDPSEVWANVTFSNDFCLCKVEAYPWWPARKCFPKDENLASNLEVVGRTLVSLIGESGSLRIVKADSVIPFSETLPEDEDLSKQSRDVRNQLDECMAMARRIVRGQQEKKKTKGKKLSVNGVKTGEMENYSN